MKKCLFGLIFLTASHAFAQSQPATKAPFEGYNTSWINGQNRQTEFPLILNDANGQTILTGMAVVDAYYNYDFNRPLDNTHVSSASVGRSNEFTLNLVSFGFESYYKNIIARTWVQAGSMLNLIQDTDASVLRGRNTSVNNLKLVREAAVGYHFSLLNGLNVEAGLFSSFLGMDSYLTQENWSYQRAMVNDFVPSYLTGMRFQLFPCWKVKTELWIVNGWQSYNRWNTQLGIGSYNLWRPHENFQATANLYVGNDSRSATNRFHHDNSIAYRYFRSSSSAGISQAALALNIHFGFQWGDGATLSQQNIWAVAAMNRLWFMRNLVALTTRYDYLANKGLYLAFTPTTAPSSSYSDALASQTDNKLRLHQLTATLDVMPNSFFTFRVEYGLRRSNLPYFAGRMGTTSPDGWIDTPTSSWHPALSRSESRLTLCVSVRL